MSFDTRVTKLMTQVNQLNNDYQAYLRPGPAGGGPQVAHQYKLDTQEAKALVDAITSGFESTSDQSAILDALYQRSISREAFGALSLTQEAAQVLTGLAAELG